MSCLGKNTSWYLEAVKRVITTEVGNYLISNDYRADLLLKYMHEDSFTVDN